MTKKEIIKNAQAGIFNGKPKQAVYEDLKQSCNLPAEDLAKIIQHIPSLEARQNYRALNGLLIGLLLITIFLQILAGILFFLKNGIIWFPIFFIFSLINIYLLIGVIRFVPFGHKMVGIFAVISVLNSLSNVIGDEFDPFMVFNFFVIIGIIILGFYLSAKLCPDYIIKKERYQNNQGQDRLRNVIRFID